MQSLITFKHVYKTYDNDRHALRDVSFSLNKNELIFLTGESGAGKTTLFKLISAQEKITSGELNYNSQKINELNISQKSDYRKKIGIIFQDFRLIKDLNIFDNIAIPLQILKKSKKEISLNVLAILEQLNLKDYSKSFPEHISGGEKQRVAIARALVHQPEIIIADEPTGNLDRKNAEQIMTIFKGLSSKGVAVLIATHDESFLKVKNARHIELSSGQILKDVIL